MLDIHATSASQLVYQIAVASLYDIKKGMENIQQTNPNFLQ